MTQPITNSRLRKIIGIDEFKKDCKSPLFVAFIMMLTVFGLPTCLFVLGRLL